MLGRLINLLKAKFTRGISALETPEVLAEEALNNLETSVKKVQEGVVASLTNEKMLEQQIKKAQDELGTWEKRAGVAVSQNNDDLARECLQKKQELSRNIATFTTQLQDQKTNTANLKAQHAELTEQLRTLKNKASGLGARAQASDALSKANELIASGTGTNTDKWERKIQEKEFRAEALHEMGKPASGDKFAQLDQHAEIEDELAALKAKSGSTKLIADQGASGEGKPAKTVVDDNVPMVIEPNAEDEQSKKKE